MSVTQEQGAASDLCEQLRAVLLDADPKHLESIASFALSSLLGVPFRNARAGDQRGGDGGVSGIGNRNLVFEARRYKPDTRFDERAIRGQIGQAAERNPDLEAWILVTTREVPEQIQDAMNITALEHGVDAIAIDWLCQPLPKLACLVASCPDIVASKIGEQHRALLVQIAQLPDYPSTLASIDRELQSWRIGYESIRRASHRRVQDIWNSRSRALAKFHQNVAGGEEDAQHVRRSSPIDRLDDWFDGPDDDATAALVGLDGVGKTWVALDWLQLRLDRLPIVVLAPSSAIGAVDSTRSDPINLIARYLHEISEVRDVSYWEQRVRRLLARPADEGPVFVLFFDGLNQLQSHDWRGIFYQLADQPFHQCTRTLISARRNFFDEHLNGLDRSLVTLRRINIGNYDLAAGGEFDQKLKRAGLSREDLPNHLIDHAAVPRMFDLIVRLRSDLGSVQEVTVHRLLWAYGALAIPASSSGAFSEQGWRRFLLDLAKEHKDGSHRSTRRRIDTLSASPTLNQDQVYRRVSGVIDGIFANLDQDGDPEFSPEFVHHALGLALVARLEKAEADESSSTALDTFLDPIAGYDGRAETLRAAVSIALLRNNAGAQPWLGNLCTYWLHSQNLPESHLNELKILAPELVVPILDVIEASCGHSLTTPRHNAIAALATVDNADPDVAAVIAERASRWLRCISLGMRAGDPDHGDNSHHAHRCKRLRKRIGVTGHGIVTIAGREFEIVGSSGDELVVAAAQLLQHRPLKDSIEFFVRGAIHFALLGSGAAHETHSWLNTLNVVDPEETGAGLRSASREIRLLAPQPGHHPQLYARVASILLWRTGYSEDAEEAWRLDPKIDHHFDYETDYLSNPSQSLFRLERRHTAQVLRDKNLPLARRIEKAKDAMLDPFFQIPVEFVEDLLSEVEDFPFDRTAVDRGRTSEDLNWEALSLALARCRPTALAKLERLRLQSFSKRPAEQRWASSFTARDAMLLVERTESAALQALRQRRSGESTEDERIIQSHFLICEIQAASPVSQVEKILNSDLDLLGSSLDHVCRPLSQSDIDHLVNLYGSDKRMLSRLAIVLSGQGLDLSQRAFDTFSELLFDGVDNATSGAAWFLLGSNDSERLGAALDRLCWSWSPSKPHIENIMGSNAIAVSNRYTPFSEFASRIAPARLLATLSRGQRSREEVRLAVDLLSATLFQYHQDAPQAHLDIFHDYEAAASRNYEVTIGSIIEDHEDKGELQLFLERANQPERYAQRRQKIIQAYLGAVKRARQSGAQFLHCHFDAEDFDIVLQRYPEALDIWLDGMDSLTKEYSRRVRLAEGFYVALCEALFRYDPPRGICLWRTLGQCLTIRFINKAGIDRLKYAPFMAPDCAAVEVVLRELYSMEEAPTDEDLFDIIVAARVSSRIDWLKEMVSEDEKSPSPAHRRRAAFIRPLLTPPVIAEDAQWPSGAPVGGYQDIHDHSWILAQREAFSRHWLRKFAQADTLPAAHASWLLFMASSDHRARSWMAEEYARYASGDELIESAKKRFLAQQRYCLEQAMTDNQKPLRQNFSNQRYTRSLLPWRAQ